MPGRGRVRTLQDLSLSKSQSLVHDACQEIERRFPSQSGEALKFDSQDCRTEVGKVEAYLSRNTVVITWNQLFNGSTLEIPCADERLLYASFLYFSAVPLYKLTIPTLPDSSPLQILHPYLPHFPYLEDFHHRCALYKSRVNFWLTCVPMLPDLVELDLRGVQCEEIVRAFCKSCNMLEIIWLAKVSEETMLFVITSCARLRRLTCALEDNDETRYLIHYALERCDRLEYLSSWISDELLSNVPHTLNLRTLLLDLTEPEGIDVVAFCCPDLEKLGIFYTSKHMSKIRSQVTLQKIAESKLKLTKLTLQKFYIDSRVFDEYFSTPDIRLTELTIVNTDMCGSLHDWMRAFSKCKSLARLCLEDVYGYWEEDLATTPEGTRIRFPRLQHLHVHDCGSACRGITLARSCLMHAESLTSFKLEVDEKGADFEDRLIPFFVNRRMKMLEEVSLWCGGMKVSSLLVRHVVNYCPLMTRLKIGTLSVLAHKYVRELEREVKRKNLDFTVHVL